MCHSAAVVGQPRAGCWGFIDTGPLAGLATLEAWEVLPKILPMDTSVIPFAAQKPAARFESLGSIGPEGEEWAMLVARRRGHHRRRGLETSETGAQGRRRVSGLLPCCSDHLYLARCVRREDGL